MKLLSGLLLYINTPSHQLMLYIILSDVIVILIMITSINSAIIIQGIEYTRYKIYIYIYSGLITPNGGGVVEGGYCLEVVHWVGFG